MFLDKLIKSIGHFFDGIFSSIKHAWNQFETHEQDAVIQASTILDLVRTNIDAAPDALFGIIQLKFPNITKEELHDVISNTAAQLQIADKIVNEDLGVTLKNLQTYLGTLSDNGFITTIKSIVSIMATLFAPSLTAIQKVELVLEWVYLKLVKK